MSIRELCLEETYVFRARQHRYDEGVSRPLGEVSLGVVGERLDDTAQHLVLEERRDVLLRLVVSLEHFVAEFHRGHPRGG